MLRFNIKNFKERQWELALMLLSLHGVLLWGFDDMVDRTIILCHYGLFLLWQPIWRTKDKLSAPAAILFLVAGISLIFFAGWWLLALWLTGLFGLLGGRVFSSRARSTRIGYLLAAGYLLSVLIMWVVPKLLDASDDVAAASFLVTYLLPAIPLGILLTFREPEEADQPPILDFFYTLLLMLLAVILVLGSFAIQASSTANYAEVILKVLFGLAFTLLTISWLWNPRAGFSGLGQMLSRYLLSVGMPFEKWVGNIAEHAEKESSAEQFTQSAMLEISTLPWVNGLSWITDEGHGTYGHKGVHRADFEFHNFHLSLYTKWPLTPALTIHVKLLTQIVGEFYEAKRREEAMRQSAYMQAVYETGARLTHDIKNLIQSMSALCSAAELTPDNESERLLALMRRQLPQLNQRLAMTLDKLQAPRKEGVRMMDAAYWWASLQQRYAQVGNLSFGPGEPGNVEIDAEVLDSVVDNLLQNAIAKSKHQPEMSVHCAVSDSEHFYIDVMDSGKAMPAQVAEQLFRKNVSSETGLGIGLYHAHRQAVQAGYRLSLADNRDGAVRFRLERTS